MTDMGGVAKMLFDEEWVKTSMLSNRFNTDGRCLVCGRSTASRIRKVFSKYLRLFAVKFKASRVSG